MEKVFNYEGHEVVYSYSADCPKEFKTDPKKYMPVFDNITSKDAALRKLSDLRKQIRESKSLIFFEYSSYILKISERHYRLTFKCYFK